MPDNTVDESMFRHIERQKSLGAALHNLIQREELFDVFNGFLRALMMMKGEVADRPLTDAFPLSRYIDLHFATAELMECVERLERRLSFPRAVRHQRMLKRLARDARHADCPYHELP